MNLNSLPKQCLQHILSFLPLRDLLQSHEVCRLWASLQRSVCANRRQVIICIGEEAICNIYNSRLRMPFEEVLDPSKLADREPRLGYKKQNAKDNFDLLQFDWLDSVTCDKLVSLLPNVIELKVSVYEVPSAVAIGEKTWGRKSVLLNQIIKMLARWRSTLEAFTVSISFIDNEKLQTNQDNWRLFHAINQLDSLRLLTLDVDVAPSITDIEPFQFSLLLHLEQFSFSGYKHNLELLLPSLIKYGGPESSLKRIWLTLVDADDLLRDDFTRQTGHWMRKVVHVPDLTISKFDSNVLSILDKFPRLECINISVDSLAKIPQMLEPLELLCHLTYLKMNLYNSNTEYSIIEDMNRDPCLPSVRVLLISALCLTHNDLRPFSWPSIMPNLEIVHYHDRSGDCEICLKEHHRSISRNANMIDDQKPIKNRSPLTRDESMLRRNNTKKLLSPWELCPRIRSFYYDSRTQSKRWNLSELRQYLGVE